MESLPAREPLVLIQFTRSGFSVKWLFLGKNVCGVFCLVNLERRKKETPEVREQLFLIIAIMYSQVHKYLAIDKVIVNELMNMISNASHH